MATYVYANPNNWSQQYRTSSTNDPGIPAGYQLQGGRDGAIDIVQQQYMPGVYSGGYPAYGVAANRGGVSGA